jgi:serine/threonine protein kinase
MTAEIHLMGEYQGPGEKKTVETLGAELPDGWHIIANRKLPGEQRDDLDIVVIGDSCVFVVEEKAWGPKVIADDRIWKTSRRDYINPIDRIAHLSRLVAGKLRKDISVYQTEVGRRHAVIPAVILSHDRLELTRLPTLANSELVLQLVNAQASNALIARDRQEAVFTSELKSEILSLLGAIPQQEKKTTSIGDYHVLDELAPVGLAQNFLAEANNKRAVILRCYPLAGWGPNADMTETLRREAVALAQLEDSDRVLRAYPEFQDDVNNFWVTPLVLSPQNRTLLRSDQLREHRSEDGSLPDPIILQVITDSYDALSEVHAEGITHRALHPSRILLGRQMRVRFKDFFLARLDRGKTIGQHWNRFDGDCSVQYRAPEVLEDYQLASDKSDVYSLALSISTWIMGNIPETPAIDTVCDFLRIADTNWASVLLSCLAVDQQDRPSARECYDNLRIAESVIQEVEIGVQNDAPLFEIDSIVYDRYKIVEALGQGGFAKAWKAHDINRQEYVVLKVFREGTSESAARQEFNAAQKVNGIRCARVLDILVKPEPGVLICEYAPGEDLTMYSRREDLTAENFRRIAIDILEALDAVHKLELVHRDVSPGNIIVDSTSDGHAKLIDFGLCVPEGQGKRAGTPRYMAPETLNGGLSSPASDLYGLAASILHSMLGRLPYSDTPDRRILEATAEEADTWGGIGSGIIQTLFTALSYDPSNRPSSAAQLRELIEMVADIEVDIELSEIENPTVDSLRHIYRAGENGNAGTKGLDDEFAMTTYVPTALDTGLLPHILDGKFRVLLLTGNPGDGKTSYLVKVKEELIKLNGQLLSDEDDKSGWIIRVAERTFHAVYDASESKNEISSDTKLDLAIQPAIGDGKENYTSLIAINDGRLIQYFNNRLFEYGEISSNLVAQLRGEDPLTEEYLVVDLKRRALVGSEASLGLGVRILSSLTDDSRWSVCKNCASKNVCPINKNVHALNGGASQGIGQLIKISHLRRRRRATFRDIRSAIAWMITGNRSCAEVHEARRNGRDLSKAKNSMYFDLSFESDSEDYLVQEWADFDPGRVVAPDIIRIAREQGILHATETVDEQQAARSLLRQIFFGAKPIAEVAAKDVMAYEHLSEFEHILNNPDQDSRNRLLLGISRIVGAIGYSSQGLAISSSEKGSEWVVLKIIDSDSFTLQLPRYSSSYVENFADSVTLNHKDGASLTITLDIAEMILRAASGEILNDPYSETIRQEIEGFTAQVRRQPSNEALIFDPIGVMTFAVRDQNKITLSGGEL